MGTVQMDAAAVRAFAERVLDGADRVDEIPWATSASDDLPGSAIAACAASGLIESRIADVVAHMRTWAASAKATATAVQRADLRHAGHLGSPR